ncbi:hypothetical protein ONZ45_g13672 [Pleurotus djamor]|nr:hypothetical protein ONZ45_g13672 [Pleurotus djamor]
MLELPISPIHGSLPAGTQVQEPPAVMEATTPNLQPTGNAIDLVWHGGSDHDNMLELPIRPIHGSLPAETQIEEPPVAVEGSTPTNTNLQPTATAIDVDWRGGSDHDEMLELPISPIHGSLPAGTQIQEALTAVEATIPTNKNIQPNNEVATKQDWEGGSDTYELRQLPLSPVRGSISAGIQISEPPISINSNIRGATYPHRRGGSDHDEVIDLPLSHVRGDFSPSTQIQEPHISAQLPTNPNVQSTGGVTRPDWRGGSDHDESIVLPINPARARFSVITPIQELPTAIERVPSPVSFILPPIQPETLPQHSAHHRVRPPVHQIHHSDGWGSSSDNHFPTVSFEATGVPSKHRDITAPKILITPPTHTAPALQSTQAAPHPHMIPDPLFLDEDLVSPHPHHQGDVDDWDSQSDFNADDEWEGQNKGGWDGDSIIGDDNDEWASNGILGMYLKPPSTQLAALSRVLGLRTKPLILMPGPPIYPIPLDLGEIFAIFIRLILSSSHKSGVTVDICCATNFHLLLPLCFVASTSTKETVKGLQSSVSGLISLNAT